MCIVAGVVLVCAGAARASDLDEIKVKREQVFEFEQTPQLTRQGDNIAISFTSKDACDATVAIEDADGKIDRRLFVADIGNYRIFSVKLDYHATERVALRDFKEGPK
jgi:hypothetical protein